MVLKTGNIPAGGASIRRPIYPPPMATAMSVITLTIGLPKPGYGKLKPCQRMPPGAVVVEDTVTVTKANKVFPGALFYMEKLVPVDDDGQSLTLLPLEHRRALVHKGLRRFLMIFGHAGTGVMPGL
jgi:hypothetical protein